MGKVVILGGNARSGKSTLSFELVKHGYSRISLDNFESILKNTFNIEFSELENKQKMTLLENILEISLNESINEDTNIVIDMYDYLPSDLIRIKNINKIEVYFLAYPNCTKEEIKYNVTHYAKSTDWIAQVNDKYLDECVNRFYERNEMLKKECKDYNFDLIDTKSGIDRNKVLQNLLNKIIE